MIPSPIRPLLNWRTGLLLAAPALTGCELWPYEAGYPYTTTDPISDFGLSTHELYATITYIVSVIMVLVSILLAYTLFAFRDDGSEGNPEQIHGNTQMEIAWTLLPVAIVLSLIIPTVRTIFKTADAAPAGAMDDSGMVITDDAGKPVKPTVDIKVIGKRWWWAFEYVGTDVVSGNHLAIPDDRPVNFLITSDTVIHSFWIPRIGGKRDAVPGRVNNIWFNLTEDVPAGEVHHIRGECAEYCGEAHALMRFEVIALDGPDFDKWMGEYAEGPTSLNASVKAKGEAAFLEAGCVGCHVVRGNETANGKIGPDLTFFGDRRYLAAGVEDMFPTHLEGEEQMAYARETLTKWITDPNSIKPGTTKSANASRSMDGMNIPKDANGDGVLTEDEFPAEKVADIVEYLLQQQSSYPLR